MTTDLDPRWEWIETTSLDGPEQWTKGRCRHLDTVPVQSGGAVVAHLCLTCDEQLPVEWEPDTPRPDH
ncbi:hypothetical protein ACGFWI_01200 [Streptomyces sp. NPDC048434]|uniref:hypothetical protein n=1 Tax=Streptomyces sp. NPDC048434 TaxID=3365549 RepID=UPI00371DE52E